MKPSSQTFIVDVVDVSVRVVVVKVAVTVLVRVVGVLSSILATVQYQSTPSPSPPSGANP
jgi:hypothetical protein